MRVKFRLTVFTLSILTWSYSVGAATDPQGFSDDWLFYGKNIYNTSSADTESNITPKNVGKLQIKWIYTTTPDGQNGPTGLPGSVTATPAVEGNVLYFPDWAGNLHAVNAVNGKAIWVKNFITDYSNDPKMHGLIVSLSRNTPAIAGDLLILGNNVSQPTMSVSFNKSGAVLMAINKKTGELVWAQQLDDHPFAVVTQSPVVKDGTIYVGVSSGRESGVPLLGPYSTTVPGSNDTYHCCTFRGSFLAVDILTGKIKWKTYTLMPPDPTQAAIEKDWRQRTYGADKSYSGSSVWGNTAVIDGKRKLIYFGTGQTHMTPSTRIPGFPDSVHFPMNQIEDGNLSTGIVAVDMNDGHVVWHRNFGKVANGLDAWNAGCLAPILLPNPTLWPTPLTYCPNTVNSAFPDPITAYSDFLSFLANVAFVTPFGTSASNLFPNATFAYEPFPLPNINGPFSFDHDFAQGPMLVKNVMVNGSRQDLVIVAQKSGWTRALNPDTGATVWATFEGPGGAEGGHEWGSATDGKRVYLANNDVIPGIYYEILGNGNVTTGSYFSALDVATGNIVWEAPIPANLVGPSPLDPTQVAPALTSGPVTVANGVVYAGAKDFSGTMLAMNATTGQVLWSYATAQDSASGYSQINSRPAIVNGVVYWGAGNIAPLGFDPTAGHNKLYAFTLPPGQ